MKKRIYFDMDGTLCEWQQGVHIDTVASKGYFSKLPPVQNVVDAFHRMWKDGYDLYILSSVFCDDHSIADKKKWLSQHLPELPEEKMLFCPFGEKKKTILSDLSQTDVLIDDYSVNLHGWHGTGIKIFNGINGNNGTWKGYSVSSNMTADILTNQLEAIIEFA